MSEFATHAAVMPKPSESAQEFPGAPGPQVLGPIVWPLSLIAAICVTMILVALFTTMELPQYIHGRGVPRGALWVIVASYAITVMVWMAVEMRSTWYSQTSMDKPSAWFRRHLRRLPLFIVGFILLGYGLRLTGFMLIGLQFRLTPQFILGLVLLYESLKATLLYCCWLGLAFGVLSFVRMRAQAEHLLAAQKSLVEAKLTQLQGQLRPHFLFNTLNTISSLMQVDVARADRLLTQLGDLLRANLNMSERDVVRLADELALLRLYAGIMQERFAGRVTVDWDIAADTVHAAVPTMLLQPLMENGFKHGVERNAGSERIRVRTYRNDNRLHIAIENTGSTLADAYQDGWGLRNCRERLRLLYGADASLTLNSVDDGVLAMVAMPWRANN